MAAPKAEILFFKEGVKFSLRNKKAIIDWLVLVAKKHGKKIASLNYIFVNDDFLIKMNREYLKHDTYTDIITFDFSDKQKPGRITGEVYISLDRVKENAELFLTSSTNELHRVMAHGLLHLCGFKDKSATDKKRMRNEEENALDLRKF